jgi:DHA1 family multidrug resistance protein-like MFS transporter
MLFEATFTLFGQQRLGYGPAEAGMVFMTCSMVMLPIQFLGIALARRIGEFRQMAAGFALMGLGFLALLGASGISLVTLAIVLLGAGMAFVLPVPSSLTSKRNPGGSGRALGRLSAAQSAGQVAGSLLGGLLLGWGARLPYLAAGIFLLVLATAFAVGTRPAGDAARDSC